MTKRNYCVLMLFLSVCGSLPTVAQATSKPAQHTTHNQSSDSRKAYLKQQKKQQKKMRKEQKKSQKQLEKLHNNSH